MMYSQDYLLDLFTRLYTRNISMEDKRSDMSSRNMGHEPPTLPR